MTEKITIETIVTRIKKETSIQNPGDYLTVNLLARAGASRPEYAHGYSEKQARRVIEHVKTAACYVVPVDPADATICESCE